MLLERANAGLHQFTWTNLVKPLFPLTSVLDIGCGSGAWLHRFAEAGVPGLTGIDLDTIQFKVPGVQAVSMNIDAYNGEVLGAFELITCLELMEHIENVGKLVDLIAKHLAPRGTCILSTPNIHSRNARLRYALKGELGHFDTKSDPTHIYPVYTANLQKLLHRRGLRIASVHAFPEGPSKNYNRPVRWLSALMGPLLTRTTDGDNIIYVIRHS